MCPSPRVYCQAAEAVVGLLAEEPVTLLVYFSNCLSHLFRTMLKSVVRAVGAAVRVTHAPASVARVLPRSCPTLCSPSSATTRPFTRSLWLLNSNGASSGYRPKLITSKLLSPSGSCGCGGLHTEGTWWCWTELAGGSLYPSYRSMIAWLLAGRLQLEHLQMNYHSCVRYCLAFQDVI